MEQPAQQAAQGLGQENDRQAAQHKGNQSYGGVSNHSTIDHPSRSQNQKRKDPVQDHQGKHPAQENGPGWDGHGQEQTVVFGIVNLTLGGKDAAKYRQAQGHEPRRGKVQPIQPCGVIGRGQLTEHEGEHAAEDHPHVGKQEDKDDGHPRAVPPLLPALAEHGVKQGPEADPKKCLCHACPSSSRNTCSREACPRTSSMGPAATKRPFLMMATL